MIWLKGRIVIFVIYIVSISGAFLKFSVVFTLWMTGFGLSL